MFVGKAGDLGRLAQGAICIICGRKMVRDGMTVCCGKGHAELHYHVLGAGGYITAHEATARLCEEGGHRAVWTGGFYEIVLNPRAEIPIAGFKKAKKKPPGSGTRPLRTKPVTLASYMIGALVLLVFSLVFAGCWYFFIDDDLEVAAGMFAFFFLTIAAATTLGQFA